MSKLKERITKQKEIRAKRAVWRMAQVAVLPACDYCDCPVTFRTSTTDHIIPLAKGGWDTYDNFALCCQPCNVRKANRFLVDVGMSLLRKRVWPAAKPNPNAARRKMGARK